MLSISCNISERVLCVFIHFSHFRILADVSSKCTFVVGDTSGGDELEVDNAETEEKCAENVKSEKPDATGATWEPSSKQCWAEYGNYVDSSSTDYRTCLF